MEKKLKKLKLDAYKKMDAGKLAEVVVELEEALELERQKIESVVNFCDDEILRIDRKPYYEPTIYADGSSAGKENGNINASASTVTL